LWHRFVFAAILIFEVDCGGIDVTTSGALDETFELVIQVLIRPLLRMLLDSFGLVAVLVIGKRIS